MAEYVPSSVPAVDHLTDSGRWRELGITHWHLVVDEISTTDRIRYSAERWHGLAGARYSDHTADPVEALVWLANKRMEAVHRASNPEAVAQRAGWDTPEAWQERHDTTWYMLTSAGKPAGGGVSISDGRSVDIFAEPMTSRDCTKH